MGQLRSKTNRQGVIVSGVTLGEAPITRIDGSPLQAGDNLIEDAWFIYDHPAFPNGVVYPNGAVDIDEPQDD